MPDKTDKPHPQASNRETRLARALRANLTKRKAAIADKTADQPVAGEKTDSDRH